MRIKQRRIWREGKNFNFPYYLAPSGICRTSSDECNHLSSSSSTRKNTTRCLSTNSKRKNCPGDKTSSHVIPYSMEGARRNFDGLTNKGDYLDRHVRIMQPQKEGNDKQHQKPPCNLAGFETTTEAEASQQQMRQQPA